MGLLKIAMSNHPMYLEKVLMAKKSILKLRDHSKMPRKGKR